MTEKQKELLNQLSKISCQLAEECKNDTSFDNIMINNNDLFPMSLDEWSAEWKALLEGNR